MESMSMGHVKCAHASIQHLWRNVHRRFSCGPTQQLVVTQTGCMQGEGVSTPVASPVVILLLLFSCCPSCCYSPVVVLLLLLLIVELSGLMSLLEREG